LGSRIAADLELDTDLLLLDGSIHFVLCYFKVQ
jgi:hypothetical protein